MSDLSKSSLKQIIDNIKQDNQTAAKKFLYAVLKKVTRLETFPKSGRIIPEFEIENLREIIYGKYRIVYEIERETVSILTVFHGMRLLKLTDLE